MVELGRAAAKEFQDSGIAYKGNLVSWRDSSIMGVNSSFSGQCFLFTVRTEVCLMVMSRSFYVQ